MTNEQIIGIIITGAIFLLIAVLGVVMLTGRGAFLIAGFNTMSKEKQGKYKKEALCKFVGLILLLVTFFSAGITVGAIFEVTAVCIVSAVLLASVIVFALIFANTKAFKKEPETYPQNNGETDSYEK